MSRRTSASRKALWQPGVWLIAIALVGGPATAQAHVPLQQPVVQQPVVTPPPNAKEPTTTAIRKFLKQKNRILVTREAPQKPIALGRGTLTVSGIGAFEPGRESERLLGLRIVVDAPDLKQVERVHYMDLHEIESLLRGMPAIRAIAAEGGRGFPTDAVQKSLEGFGVGISVDGPRTKYFVLAGKDGRHRLSLKQEEFLQLEKRVAAALDRLFNVPE